MNHTPALSHAKVLPLVLIITFSYCYTSMDTTAPATKADISGLSSDMANLSSDMANLRSNMVEWKEEIKSHFDVVAENLHADMVGAHRDKISLIEDTTIKHEGRIAVLERHVGVL